MADDDKTTTRRAGAARAAARTTPAVADVEAVVLLDTYSWHDDPRDPTSPRNDAVKGDTITVTGEEFDRAQDMNPQGLGKPKSDEAKVAAGELDPPEPPLTKPDGDPVGEVAPSDDQ